MERKSTARPEPDMGRQCQSVRIRASSLAERPERERGHDSAARSPADAGPDHRRAAGQPSRGRRACWPRPATAGRWRCARQSITRRKLAAVQAARLAYEELRHRLEPRRLHPIDFGVGLLLLLVLSGAAALLLGLLLVALHGLGPRPGWPAVSGHTRGSMVFGALTGTFILVLTAGAAALMAHMEPASLLVARRRWHRARTAYEEAVETEHADVRGRRGRR